MNLNGQIMNQAIPQIFVLILSVMLAGCEKHGHHHDAAKTAEKSGEKDEHHDEVKLSAEAIRKYDIKIEAVKRHKLTPTVIAPARISFNTEAMAHVGTPLRGRVIDLKARKGDDVKKGDALILVESPELGEAQSDFLQKSAALASARPVVEFAKSAYERAKTLYEGTKGIPLTELQKREAESVAAQGSLQAAEAALTAAGNKLRLFGMDQNALEELQRTKQIQPRFAITAPIAGRVIEREVTLGELVSSEKDSLLILADISTLWVLADVPEARIAEIAIGAPVRVKLAAANAGAIEGKISLIDTALDPHSRSARVRIEIENKYGLIRPGMFAQVEGAVASAEANEPVLAIPEEAMQTVEGSAAVFVPVEDEENTFAKRALVVGKPVGGMLPVFSGLKEGEPVVVKGSFLLKAELAKVEAEHHH
jgi:membrane fusion protein, heavy metal efflux system